MGCSFIPANTQVFFFFFSFFDYFLKTCLYEVLDCSIRVFECYIRVQQFFLSSFQPYFTISIWYTLFNFHSEIDVLSQSEQFCQCSTCTVMDHTHILSRKIMG